MQDTDRDSQKSLEPHKPPQLPTTSSLIERPTQLSLDHEELTR